MKPRRRSGPSTSTPLKTSSPITSGSRSTRRTKRARVVVLKGVPGTTEDPAYFLPRRFDGVTRAGADSINEGRFWAAFRDAAWDESRPPLKTMLDRGYRAERVYETQAQGQRAFLVLFTRAG